QARLARLAAELVPRTAEASVACPAASADGQAFAWCPATIESRARRRAQARAAGFDPRSRRGNDRTPPGGILVSARDPSAGRSRPRSHECPGARGARQALRRIDRSDSAPRLSDD